MATPDKRDKLNNKEIFIATAGTEVTIRRTNGSDTATDRYLNFDYGEIMKIEVVPDDEALITEWDGKIMDHPLKLHGDKGMVDRRQYQNFSTFKIYTLKANTKIRFTMWGYG